MHRSARDVCSRRCCDVSYSWKRHTHVMSLCSGSGGGSGVEIHLDTFPRLTKDIVKT